MRELKEHQKKISNILIRDLFTQDINRFRKFSIECGDIFLDYSKNLLTDDTMDLLFASLKASDFNKLRDGMFSGEKINTTENRAVLHTALRNFSDTPVTVDSYDVMPDIKSVLKQMEDFSDDVHSERHVGFSGKKLTNIVNIGIGGSILGGQLVINALNSYRKDGMTCQFVANVDGAEITDTLKNSDPETTLFVIASKTFTTSETMANATTARTWLVKYFGDKAAVSKHFVAVSANTDMAVKFGIETEHIFTFWDWVGGRYSVWSSIGLTIPLVMGYNVFEAFLRGAHEMDQHFKNAPMQKNLPVLLGLISVWYRNFWHAQCHSIVPYATYLQQFPTWLQQVDMESNGKYVTKNGSFTKTKTGGIIFGCSGTGAQHSYFQLMHQGTDMIPADFIGIIKQDHALKNQHRMLLANMLAQSEALMLGDQNETEPHRYFPGNRPTNTILLKKLTPHSLGMLMAMYEHKIFVQGALWNINSFDQYGVELGKSLACKIENEAKNGGADTHDGSTTGLFQRCFK